MTLQKVGGPEVREVGGCSPPNSAAVAKRISVTNLIDLKPYLLRRHGGEKV